MEKHNYSFRSCQIFALLGKHSNSRSYQIHLNHEISYEVAKAFAVDSGIEGIVGLAENSFSRSRAWEAENAHATVNGSYVELPIYNVTHQPEKENEVTFECKVYLAVCVGDNHSKLFVRMSTGNDDYPSLLARDFANEFAKKLISEIIAPKYRQLSKNMILEAEGDKWQDVEVSELYYVPLEAVRSDDYDVREAFKGLAAHTYEKLVDAFRDHGGFQSTVKDNIISRFNKTSAVENLSLVPESDEAIARLEEALQGLEWVFVDNIGGNDGLFLIERDEESLSDGNEQQPSIKYRGIFVDSNSSPDFDLNETTDNYLNAVVG